MPSRCRDTHENTEERFDLAMPVEGRASKAAERTV
jgi:hypothetical protein